MDKSNLIIETVPSLAKLWQRSIAFFLDFFLVFNFSMILLLVYILPQKYPGKMTELRENVHSALAAKQNLNTIAHSLRPDQLEMAYYCQNVNLLVYWMYFMLSDVFLNGSSLGKRIFRLKVLKYRTYEGLNFWDICMRSAIKALALVWFFPLLLINYALAFFNKSRQAGHDYLARSIVVEENLEE